MDVAPSSKTTEDAQARRARWAEIGQDSLERSGDAFKVENGLIKRGVGRDILAPTG